MVFHKGALNSNFKHGLRKHPLYSVWRMMISRCTDPDAEKFSDYGGRGIEVCVEWQEDFLNFYEWAIANGWKKGLQLDRENNDSHYEPGNCGFVTPSANCLNRRVRKDSISGYKGVSWNTHHQKWVARIMYKGMAVNVGSYATTKLAVEARNRFIMYNKWPHQIQEVV